MKMMKRKKHAKSAQITAKIVKIPRKYWIFGGLFGGGKGIRTLVRLLSNGFQEVYQRIPFPLSSVQFVLKRFAKILILQGFFGLFGTVLN